MKIDHVHGARLPPDRPSQWQSSTRSDGVLGLLSELLDGHPPHRLCFARGQRLAEQGAKSAAISVHLGGWASAESHLRNGDRALFDFLTSGDITGLGDVDGMSAHTVTALTDVTVLRLERAQVDWILDNNQKFRRFYLHAFAAQLDRARAWRVALSAKTAIERIAGLLAELTDRFEGGNARTDAVAASDHPRLSQVMLSCAADLTPATVNRVVQVLRRSGAIEWDSNGLRVLDRQRLLRFCQPGITAD
jgi:CRP-like cAMP-binding protein